MVLSRRLLRVAALGAVIALALAGTALAETYTWRDSVLSGSWNDSNNWTSGSGTGYPGATDTAIFTKDAKITNLENPSKAAELKFTGNATLTLNGGSGQYLEVKKITVAGGKQVTIDSRSEISISLGANSPIEVGSGATLTIEYGGVFSGAGELQLSGGGTLDLKISVDDVHAARKLRWRPAESLGTRGFYRKRQPDAESTASCCYYDNNGHERRPDGGGWRLYRKRER